MMVAEDQAVGLTYVLHSHSSSHLTSHKRLGLMPKRVLILSAGVGRGHQSAAKGLRDELLRMAPDVRVVVHNGLGAAHGPVCQRGQLHIPVCALVTDIASLHFWAHPGTDLHLASSTRSPFQR